MAIIRLTAIAFDSGTQIRATINESVVAEYAERMTEGVTFPPIVLFTDGTCREDGSPLYYLADGFHRTQAALRNDFRDIEADVRPGTKQDALWFALGANRANGQRLTEADKKHAVVLALKAWPDRSTTQIAEQVGCTHPYVLRIRGQVVPSNKVPDRVTGKDGKSYPSTRPRTTAEDQRRAEIARLAKEGATNAAISEAVGAVSNSTIAKVRKELGVGSPVDKSRAAVEQRHRDIRDMAERGFTTRQIAAAINISEPRVSDIAKQDGIVIHADRVVGKIKRHDSNRIVAQIVADAENLTEGADLIDFNDLNRAEFAGWLASLQESRDKLGVFIRRLMKEQQKHGEAA